MATVIFWPTRPTNQHRPIAKIFSFCVFYPIWMKFGMGAKNNIEWVWNGYGHFLTYQTDQPKPTNNENFQLLRFSSDLNEIWFGGKKQHRMSLKWLRSFFYLAHSRADVSNITPPTQRFWSFLVWRYPLGRNLEIQNFLALWPLGGLLWTFQIFAFWAYLQFLNGHNLASTHARRLVLVSNI